jgi:hypothetical protein
MECFIVEWQSRKMQAEDDNDFWLPEETAARREFPTYKAAEQFAKRIVRDRDNAESEAEIVRCELDPGYGWRSQTVWDVDYNRNVKLRWERSE